IFPISELFFIESKNTWSFIIRPDFEILLNVDDLIVIMSQREYPVIVSFLLLFYMVFATSTCLHVSYCSLKGLSVIQVGWLMSLGLHFLTQISVWLGTLRCPILVVSTVFQARLLYFFQIRGCSH
ncbi:hypothetical protein Pfo_010064, partial [Paulownia fortunei]